MAVGRLARWPVVVGLRLVAAAAAVAPVLASGARSLLLAEVSILQQHSLNSEQ